MGKSLTLVMIVKNEEGTLKRCLDSVVNLVDEMIIVDTGSQDSTKDIAESYNAKVYDFIWNGSFSDARNFALEKSTGDWNLVLDADEYMLKDDGEVIRNFINNNHELGRVKIINKFMDKGGIGYSQSFTTRLIPAGLFYTGRIHEQILSDLPRVKLSVEVKHEGYFQKNKSDRNIPILQQEIQDHPEDPYFYYQIAKEYKGLQMHQQYYESISNAYRLLNRYENYAPSVIVAYLYAIIDMKKWDEGLMVLDSEKSHLDDYTDFHFVSGVFYLELILSDLEKYHSYLPRIEQSYLKCLEIGENEKYDGVVGAGSYLALYNLGVLYEVSGMVDKAIDYYKKAAAYEYNLALDRLNQIAKS